MINSKKLMYFIAVAEEMHFGRAASRLAISQPPLTNQIKMLEEELGVSLFKRSTRTVTLTKEGALLYEHAKKIIADINNCKSVVNNVERDKEIVLGVLHAHTYTFLPDLLRYVFSQNPDLSIRIVEYTTSEQIKTIRDKRIDLGIIREPIAFPGIIVDRIYEEEYVLAIPTDWMINPRKEISIKELEGKSIIVYPSHDSKKGTSNIFIDFLHQHKVILSKKIELNTIHSALSLVAAGRGFTPVPSTQSKMKFPHVSYLKIKEPAPTLSIAIAWNERYLEPHFTEFIKLSKSFFNELNKTV
ncbi:MULTISPECIES: LysR family transcriptional regulator [unclassified Comamonas]|uniref:LysR family transcriptional regulator n=1 Tax=unclassified Comamonas TaxID=2638500 RepID=UPI001FA6E5EF|nr:MULTISPECIES: LysR substrate-binding domain-containing protein [unclassified Comamonas]UNV88716.1 LysR substrate-binding domain-containing protein [Comamonas sp. 7D-2evo1]UNV93379.1 LysR substrate-binding domain-containing protein [Comamonas sp. 7D-2]UNV98359.1 LysR substrate-binding domain-containing protein [Comamonas sp. 7D-2evo2]